MSEEHPFGGSWTDDKVDRLRQYLTKYTLIFTRNPRARFYTTHYVDAFAGTGYRTQRAGPADGEVLISEPLEGDPERLIKGSARLALEVQPPFDRYLLIEKARSRAAALEAMVADFPQLADRIEVAHAEANTYLRGWVARTDWEANRAVVFLDAYGLQVEWAVVEALARTRGVDLWVLYPLAGVNRLLTRESEPPPEFAAVLTRLLGTAVA